MSLPLPATANRSFLTRKAPPGRAAPVAATPHRSNAEFPRRRRVKATRGELWGLRLQKGGADWLLREEGGVKGGSRRWGTALWNWRLERSWKRLGVRSTVRGSDLLGAPPGVCQSKRGIIVINLLSSGTICFLKTGVRDGPNKGKSFYVCPANSCSLVLAAE